MELQCAAEEWHGVEVRCLVKEKLGRVTLRKGKVKNWAVTYIKEMKRKSLEE